MRRILLLNTDKGQGELFAAWLKERDYEVKTTEKSGEIEGALSEEGYDVLLMDIDFSENEMKFNREWGRVRQHSRPRYQRHLRF